MKTIKFALLLIAFMVISSRTESQVVLVAEKTDSSLISNILPVGNKLFFSSWSYTDSIEIWATDGSITSSKMIKKFPSYSDPMFFFEFKENLIFHALENYSVDKSGNTISTAYLWITDGTADGTVKIKKLNTWFYLDDDIPHTWGGKYIELGDKLLFAATAPDTLNFELWKTDGTSNGTSRLLEINKYNQGEPYWADYRSSFPTSLIKMGNKIYFSANDAIHGQELWVTDGTAAETHLVKDISKGDTVSFAHYYHQEVFITSNNKLFLTAFYARQLWVSDGTELGTKPINKVNYVTKIFNQDMFVDKLTDVNGSMFFQVAYWSHTTLDYDSLQLWKTDGTENGTLLVYSLNKMDVSSFTSYKSNLYFLNKNVGLYELWKSDGTKTGTLKISEFKIPDNSTSKLYVFNDSIYFAALDANNILKIWKSDGTSNGTKPVENWDEPKLTSISELVLFNDGVYFAAKHPKYGTSLFKYINGKHVIAKIESEAYFNNLSIYPNPVKNNLNINLPKLNQKGLITIYNINGTKLLSYTIKPGQETMRTDVSILKKGLYIISFTGNSGLRLAKFVKE